MKNIFKHITLSAAAIALSITALSAQGLTSYYMPNAVDKMEYNAAFAPNRGYFNVPLVGSTWIGTNGNLALSDLIVSQDGGLYTIFDTNVSAATALANLNDVNTFGFDSRIGILGFGKYCKDKTSFWSFGVNLRTSANISMPYELVEFFKTTPESSSIEDVNLHISSYAEVAMGYSTKLTDRLTVGAKVKLLVGLMNADLNINKMDVTMSAEQWMVDADGTFSLDAEGMSVNNEDGTSSFDFNDIEGTPEGPAGYGGAIDVGATYQLTKRLKFSVAANDIGFITWNSSANTTANVANSFNFEGASYDANDGMPSDGAEDILFTDIVMEQCESTSSTSWLQSNINASAEYSFFNNRLTAGVIYSTDFWKSNTMHTLTIAGSYTPINCITIGASYALTDGVVGLAANFATGFINLYVATDIIMSETTTQYIPINQTMMNVSFGIAIPLGPKGERNL